MTSILHPPVEGAAFDTFLQNSAPASRNPRVAAGRWRHAVPLPQPRCAAGLQ